MKRMRNVGIAVAAALALTAVAGSAPASASWLVSEAEDTVFVGKSTSTHVFMTTAAPIECNGNEVVGAVEGTYKSQTLTTDVSNYSCYVWGETTLKTDDCQFTYNPGAEISPGSFEGTIDIGPAGCGPIALDHPDCDFTVPAQSGLTASFSNNGEGSEATVMVKVQADDLVYATGEFCAPEGEFENGSYVGSWEISGFSGVGNQVGVHVAETVPNGLYVAGEESEVEGNQPKFAAEEYPATLTGRQANPLILESESGYVECEEVQLDGSASATSATLALDAQHEDCTTLGLESSVSMNGCHYELGVANSGPPYSGTVEVVCEEGSQIEIEVLPGFSGEDPFCTLAIPAQTFAAASYETLGEGWNRYVRTTVAEGQGFEYSITGGGGYCGEEGSHEDGAAYGALRLDGLS